MDTTSFLPALEMQGRELGLYTQCFSAGSVLGRRHLDTAFVNAVKNFAYSENYARSFPLEVLLMLSAQRQIKEALEHFGLTDTKSFLLFLTPRKGVEDLIRDYSIENMIAYRKNFDKVYREFLLAGHDKLIKGLGLTEKWIITCNGQKKSPEIIPNELLQYKLLTLAGVKLSVRKTEEPIIIEKMVCEKINLIQCK